MNMNAINTGRRLKYKEPLLKFYDDNKAYVICNICGMKMGCAYWGRHNQRVHLENILPIITPTVHSNQLKPPTRYCKICGNNYLSLTFEKHEKSRYHLKRLLEESNGVKPDENKQYCEICEKTMGKLYWDNHIYTKKHKKLEKLYFSYLDDSLFV